MSSSGRGATRGARAVPAVCVLIVTTALTSGERAAALMTTAPPKECPTSPMRPAPSPTQERDAGQHIVDGFLHVTGAAQDTVAEAEGADAVLQKVFGQGGVNAVGRTIEAAVEAADPDDGSRSGPAGMVQAGDIAPFGLEARGGRRPAAGRPAEVRALLSLPRRDPTVRACRQADRDLSLRRRAPARLNSPKPAPAAASPGGGCSR